MARYTETDTQEARRLLREWLKPGDTVSVSVTSVSRSGMTRWMIPVITGTDGYPTNISYHVARAVGWGFDDRGVKAEGTGMDMCFHMIYTLSAVLYPTYACLGAVCMSGDHVNWRVDENGLRVPPPARLPGASLIHRDGYALTQVRL